MIWDSDKVHTTETLQDLRVHVHTCTLYNLTHTQARDSAAGVHTVGLILYSLHPKKGSDKSLGQGSRLQLLGKEG